ncbi:RNA polymerase sigma factor [Streptomyces sp. NPDC020800]|uniref:RNA polymerase sigma factor n=1 Tax=Streptomyces sp. NPDC020800 TaxID=3365092 RepID=UPI0037ACE19C
MPSVVDDAALQREIGHGDAEAFQTLRERHYESIHAYAASCVSDPQTAHEISQVAFLGLLQVLEARSKTMEPNVGCVRIFLANRVRGEAVRRAVRGNDFLSIPFRQWVDRGCMWPLEDIGQLGAAYSQLTDQQQTLLWHAVVEQDTPRFISDITGIPFIAVSRVISQTRSELFRSRVHLYLDLACPAGCVGAMEEIFAVPEGSSFWNFHLDSCYRCADTQRKFTYWDTLLAEQLPAILLGWWNQEIHRQMKHTATESRQEYPARSGSPTVPSPAARPHHHTSLLLTLVRAVHSFLSRPWT